MKTDGELQRDVIAELDWEPSVDPADIGVSVVDGVVTLNGFVKSFAEKLAAERAVRRVAGVNAIAQEIKVRFVSDPKTADHEIAKRILDMLKWSSMVPSDHVKVKVEQGWVTLTGEVNWHYQSEEAERIASLITGVTAVTNSITVAPRVAPGDVRKRIQDAFQRQANLDAASISVSVDGGKVTLAGQVRAPYERRAAEKAAWAASGVVQVEDRIVVTA